MKNLTVQQALIQLVENAEKMSNDATWFYRQDVYKEKITHAHKVLPTLDCGCIAGFTLRQELEFASTSTDGILLIFEDIYSDEVVSAIWPIFSEVEISSVVNTFGVIWTHHDLDEVEGKLLETRLLVALRTKAQRDAESVPFHEYGFGG